MTPKTLDVDAEPTAEMLEAALDCLPYPEPVEPSAVANALRAAIAIAPSIEAEPVGWREIESAPKDGTHIDMWCVSDEYPEGERVTDCHWGLVSLLGGLMEEERWTGYQHTYRTCRRPTHWMPLPSAPGVTAPPSLLSELEEAKRLLTEALWHWGADDDRKQILDAGGGWKTDTFEVVALIRAFLAKGAAR